MTLHHVTNAMALHVDAIEVPRMPESYAADDDGAGMCVRLAVHRRWTWRAGSQQCSAARKGC